MYYLDILEEMRRKLKENLEKYFRKHPGEFYVLAESPSGSRVTFRKTRKGQDGVIANYRVGSRSRWPTLLSGQIPAETHRFNPDNKTFDVLYHFFDVCPNDLETKLKIVGRISHTTVGIYREEVRCPDCNYRAYRRPTDEAIRRHEENIRLMQKTSSLMQSGARY